MKKDQSGDTALYFSAFAAIITVITLAGERVRERSAAVSLALLLSLCASLSLSVMTIAGAAVINGASLRYTRGIKLQRRRQAKVDD
jgi:hypothetical protein